MCTVGQMDLRGCQILLQNQTYSSWGGFFHSHKKKKSSFQRRSTRNVQTSKTQYIAIGDVWFKMRVKIWRITNRFVLNPVVEGPTPPGTWREERPTSTQQAEAAVSVREETGCWGTLGGPLCRVSSVNRGVGVGEPQPSLLARCYHRVPGDKGSVKGKQRQMASCGAKGFAQLTASSAPAKDAILCLLSPSVLPPGFPTGRPNQKPLPGHLCPQHSPHHEAQRRCPGRGKGKRAGTVVLWRRYVRPEIWKWMNKRLGGPFQVAKYWKVQIRITACHRLWIHGDLRIEIRIGDRVRRTGAGQ